MNMYVPCCFLWFVMFPLGIYDMQPHQFGKKQQHFTMSLKSSHLPRCPREVQEGHMKCSKVIWSVVRSYEVHSPRRVSFGWSLSTDIAQSLGTIAQVVKPEMVFSHTVDCKVDIGNSHCGSIFAIVAKLRITKWRLVVLWMDIVRCWYMILGANGSLSGKQTWLVFLM